VNDYERAVLPYILITQKPGLTTFFDVSDVISVIRTIRDTRLEAQVCTLCY